MGFAFKMVVLAEHSGGSMQGAGKARHRTGAASPGSRGQPLGLGSRCSLVCTVWIWGRESDHLFSGSVGLGQGVY